MSRLLIGITTSPRRSRYLLASVQSLMGAATNTTVHIVISPNFIDPGEDWELLKKLGCTVLRPLVERTIEEHVAAEPSLAQYRDTPLNSEWTHRGLQRNADRLMTDLVQRAPDWFLFCQDDIVCCKRAVDRIALAADVCARRGNVGAMSFYTPYAHSGRWHGAFWPYTPGFYGELALLWNRKAAIDFLKISNAGNAHDLEIQRFFQLPRQTWRLYGHSPCLVQHTGIESARGAAEGGQRTTMNFDPNHDAVLDAKRWC